MSDDLNRRYGALLDEFGGRLRQLVQMRCRGAIDPDDVEQEVRIRLWQALERDRNAPFSASYISKAVASAVIDAHRRAAVRATEPLPEPGDVDAPIEPGRPDRNASADEQVRLLGIAIGELPPRRQLPMRLHLQGFSLVEIARLTASTDEAVRKLVSRGLEELKERLRELGLDDDD
jgi:RNA polymerase sigma factor (sigma-70 family)